MIIDMRPLLRGETERILIDYALTPDHDLGQGARSRGDAAVFGSVTDSAGYMRLSLKAELPFSTECARCLSKVDGVFAVDFDRTVVTEGTLSDEQLADKIDEYVILKDGMLDINEELKETLALEFPMRILCSQDCEGLCSVCGKPKREGCGCKERYVDPRLAVLEKLLLDNRDDN